MDEFEKLLYECKGAIERYVYYKLPSKEDGDDVLQEVYLTAFQKIKILKDKTTFKAWIYKIAVNKCNDFYRTHYKYSTIPLNNLSERIPSHSRYGITEYNTVHETLTQLTVNDKKILELFYFKNYTQAEIAKILNVPIGTVKSRLFYAKQNFKDKYPYPPKLKGVNILKKLPDILPAYKIIKSDKLSFEVKWEELMGWFIVPKLGEKLTWAMYDFPERNKAETFQMSVCGKASVHGIEGVEILSTESTEKDDVHVNRTFVAQLTDTHCRILSESHFIDDVKHYYTFLDADEFLPNWGFGEDNCGNETNFKAKGTIKRNNDNITCLDIPVSLDCVGRYIIEMDGKIYDTICVMDIELYNTGVMSETYLDKNGRTVLWRRFNRDDWAFDRYQQKWSEKLPDNERVSINGETYVHWYDCISNYIL